MNLLIEYETAIAGTAYALCIPFLVVSWRYAVGIRDALFKNALPFMWINCAVITALFILAIAPVDVVEEDWDNVGGDLFAALVYGWQAHTWYRIWKNHDDDTWKKRRRRWAERIESLGRLGPVTE